MRGLSALLLTFVACPAVAWAQVGVQRSGAMSQDARYIAFSSADANLVAGDTNASTDVFVRDMQTGVTTRVSITSAGQQGTGDSGAGVDIDDSGRYVVFVSHAALVADDTVMCVFPSGLDGLEIRQCPDIYLHDRQTGQTTRVNLGSGGASANRESYSPHISGDGNWITFISNATNLLNDEVNGGFNLYLVERTTGAMRLINRPATGSANGWSSVGRLTADGSRIVFISSATNVATPDQAECKSEDVPVGRCYRAFLYDRTIDTVTALPFPKSPPPPSPGTPRVTRNVYDIDIDPLGRTIGMNIANSEPGPRFQMVTFVYDVPNRRFAIATGGSPTGVIVRDRYFVGSVEGFYASTPRVTFVGDMVSGVATRVEFAYPVDLSANGRRLLIVGGASYQPSIRLATDLALVDLDPDNDGMLWGWEQFFGLDPENLADAAADNDDDGLTNAVEHAHGSHPFGVAKSFLAEGAGNGFFATKISLFNPNQTATTFVIRQTGENHRVQSFAGSIQPRQEWSLHYQPVEAPDPLFGSRAPLAPDDAFSTTVESALPLVVERTMTWNASGYGSHAERGVAAPQTTWYLAEGATHAGFQLFYLLQNPGDAVASVTVTYLRPVPLPPIAKTYTVAPSSRRTIWVNNEDPALAATDVSARFTSTVPIVAERAMYRDVASPAQTFGVGHAAAGVNAATRWFLAEGATGLFFDLYYLIANPSAQNTTIRVTYLLTEGAPIVKTYPVAAQSRRTISVKSEDARLAFATMSAIVETLDSTGIVVERAMYWPGGGAWQEGHVTAGATATARRWATSGAELDDATGTETYVLIANTSGFAGTALVTIPATSGANASDIVRSVPLAANSRVTVRLRDLVPSSITSAAFGVIVESSGPEIVVERSTYANANGVTWAAGTALLATPLP